MFYFGKYQMHQEIFKNVYLKKWTGGLNKSYFSVQKHILTLVSCNYKCPDPN